MWEKVDNETKLGGIFGLISVIAILIEIWQNDFSVNILVSGLKDLSGTLVSVMVFYIAIRSIVRNSPKNLNDILAQKMQDFEEAYLPIIFKVQGFKSPKNSNFTQGFAILPNLSSFSQLMDIKIGSTKYNKYASYTGGYSTGKFVDFPSNDSMVKTLSNQTNFIIEFKIIESNQYIQNFLSEVTQSLQTKYGEIYSITKLTKKIQVEIPCFENERDIDRMFDLLGLTVRLYQVGNLGPKNETA